MSGRSSGKMDEPLKVSAKAMMRWIAVVGVENIPSPDASGKIARLQHGVGEIDDLEPLLRRLVAAVDVGMMQLHEFLIARLEADKGQRRRQVEYSKRLFLLRHLTTLGRLLALVGRRLVLEAEHAVIAKARRRARPGTRAHRPGRALPDRVVADFALDLVGTHAGVVVPRGVVGADMVEAEPVEQMQRRARARGAVLADRIATGMLTNARRRRRSWRLATFDAHAYHIGSMG